MLGTANAPRLKARNVLIRGVLAEKLSGDVLPTSQNPFPISDLTNN